MALLLAGLVACFLATRSSAQSPPQPVPSANGSMPSVESNPEPMRQGDYVLEKHKLVVDKWPDATFSFSIENKNKQSFRQLKPSDLTVTLDGGQPLTLPPDALKLTESYPVTIFLLLDGSKSMLGRTIGLDKLAASKESIKAFLYMLAAPDTAAVYGFHSSLYSINEPTKLKSELADKVGDIELEEVEESKHTDLYGAVKDAIARAQALNIRNLVVVSDGMQDTGASEMIRLASDEQFSSYKEKNEREIRDLATRSGVTIFTIAIGDKDSLPATPKNLSYVDADTLRNMTSQSAGGRFIEVGLPDLIKEQSASPNLSLQDILSNRLKDIFAQINSSVRYGYALKLPPLHEVKQDGQRHLLKVEIKVGGNIFTAQYPITWPRGGTIQVEDSSTTRRQFIKVPKLVLTLAQLGGVYLAMLGVLGGLALVPLALNRVERASQVRERARLLKKSVIVLKASSNLIGHDCPNHRTPKPFQEGDVVVICPKGGHPHHIGCWRYNRFRCMSWLCTGELPLPDELLKKYGAQTS